MMRKPLAFAFLALLFTGIGASPQSNAQTPGIMATEYPATAIAGEGVAVFIANLRRTSSTAFDLTPSYDATLGLKSAEMPAAVRSGRLLFADAFLPALATADPLFGLSALPFLVSSIDDTRRLADIARPAYRTALAKQGVRLLYLTPWPATGLWTKTAPRSVAEFSQLALRAYDATSARVMKNAGARAELLSFADAMPRLKAGTLDAVLSSGDGGAGRKLWEFLPSFVEINYTYPLSAAFMSETAFAALGAADQQTVTAAAEETEKALWLLVRTRQGENYARMRQNGVSISVDVPADVAAALRTAGATELTDFRNSTGEQGAQILNAYAASEAKKP
jgi:TRAP-type transport system periplasmic protein